MSAIGFSAAFRIKGDTLSPTAISHLLAIEPTSSHAKGDPRVGESKKHKPLNHGVWTNGIWILGSELPKSNNIEEHLQALLNRLEAKATELKELRSSGLALDIYCGCFLSSTSAGMVLSPQAIHRLSELNLEISFEIYAPNPDFV